MAITTTGWYKATIESLDYYMKTDAAVRLISGFVEITVAGLEGSRLQAINTGGRREITVTLYDTPAGAGDKNFQKIIAMIETSVAIGVLATDQYVAMTLTRIAGDGVASFGAFNVMPREIKINPVNKDGHNAEVTFEVFTTIPSLS